VTPQFFTARNAEIDAAPGEVVRQGIFINFWRMILNAIRRFFGAKS
jgi:hypothetical protein